MRLPRPYTPRRVRVQVAERQLAAKIGAERAKRYAHDRPLGDRLAYLLGELFGLKEVELHHRPALCNREVIWDGVRWPDMKYVLQFKSALATDARYVPDANDPDYLVYLPVDEHDIETRVRGQHGDYSDLAKARKAKRVAKKRDPKRRKYKWPSRPFARKKG